MDQQATTPVNIRNGVVGRWDRTKVKDGYGLVHIPSAAGPVTDWVHLKDMTPMTEQQFKRRLERENLS